MGGDVSSAVGAQGFGPGGGHVDPNEEYVASMSDAVVFDLTTTDYLTSPEYLAATEENARRHADLAGIEIPTAVADYACQDEVGYRRLYAEVFVELQQELYDARRTELEAWLAGYEKFQATH